MDPMPIRNTETCELIGGPQALEEAIRTRDRLFVLFYASWCPFSMAFLPHYLEHAGEEACYVRILSNDGDEHVEKYGIEVYPTILYFEKGKLIRRLDGRYLAGLSRKALDRFAAECVVKP
jgi:thiol-disulfide isomerase/thioredoxin